MIVEDNKLDCRVSKSPIMTLSLDPVLWYVFKYNL